MTTPEAPDPLTETEVRSIGEKQNAITRSRRDITWYGWKPDLPDPNDKRFAVPRATSADVAELPDFTSNFLGNAKVPVYDQDALGSCGPNAAMRAYRIAIRRTIGGLHDFDGSRLAHYYWTRMIAGDPASVDTGVYIRDTMKVFAKIGVTPEKLWPYIIENFDDDPGAIALAKAVARLRVTYSRVPQDPGTIRAVLARRRPIVFGMSVFQSTENALTTDGRIPVPSFAERVLGGHAMCIEDYDDVTFGVPVVLGTNSWGTDVGLGVYPSRLPAMYRDHAEILRGHFSLPMSVLVDPNVADDLWTIDAAA